MWEYAGLDEKNILSRNLHSVIKHPVSGLSKEKKMLDNVNYGDLFNSDSLLKMEWINFILS